MSRFILLFFVMSFSYLFSYGSDFPADSIGVEIKGGKMYVLHQVEAKETLFSISRRYKSSVPDIKAANPEAAKGLNVGQIIKVPVAGTPTQGSGLGSTHTVSPKETVFSISKKYKVSVDELTAANPGINKGLQVGQVINIPDKNKTAKKSAQPADVKAEKKSEAKNEIKKDDTEDKETAKVEGNLEEQEVEATVKKTKSALTPAPASGYKKINETGDADIMANTNENLKYLALHKSAPIGTIIQVRNDNNDQKIFVRVIGKIPNTAADKSILKLSPKAMERLGAKSEKIPVSISYIP